MSDIFELFKVYDVNGVNLNRMSEISVEKRWTCQKDEKYIVRACEELMRRTGGVRKQYEFICNVEAFVENASEAFNSNHVSMMDAFLDDQRINASSYN